MTSASVNQCEELSEDKQFPYQGIKCYANIQQIVLKFYRLFM